MGKSLGRRHKTAVSMEMMDKAKRIGENHPSALDNCCSRVFDPTPSGQSEAVAIADDPDGDGYRGNERLRGFAMP